MRHHKPAVLLWCCLGAFVLVLFLSASGALAAENDNNWRSTYDLVMRWVNFAIISILLVKFTKTPIKDFLSDRKRQIQRKIKTYEQQKKAAEEKIAENRKMLAESTRRFENIRKTIIEQGERKKQQMIEEARQESRILLEATRHKIEGQIREAGNVIRSELVESAIALAEKRLSAEITAADHQKLTDLFLAGTAGR